jgi:hypothetical protein
MIRTIIMMIAILAVLAAGTRHQQVAGTPERQPNATAVHFEAIDVYIDSGETGLAAYQVEVRAIGGDAKLVGVEGGPAGAYAAPPYYDPRALHEGQLSERIVVAGLGQGELPGGRIRVARLHTAVTGGAEYRIRVQAAGDAQGTRIEAKAELEVVRP